MESATLDPTRYLLQIKSPFGSSRMTRPDLPSPFIWVSGTKVPRPKVTVSSTLTNLPPTYVTNPKDYLDFQQIKTRIGTYNPEQYRKARDATNLYEGLSRSIFMNRAGLKLANIDALYKVTYHLGALMSLTTPGPFKFCDLAGGPGAFTQYIQWRRPDAMGYGITLRNGNPVIPDWNLSLLDQHRFLPYYGDNGTGNLYTEWNSFVRRVRSDQVEGVDLVTADGGFDVETERAFAKQEFMSFRLIMVQLLTGLKLIRPGGNLIIKMFDTVTELSAQLILIASLCFDRVTLFKPISSRPANAEKYLICQEKKNGTEQWENILEEANQEYQGDQVISNLIEGPLPESFVDWLIRCNDELLIDQRTSIEAIFDYVGGRWKFKLQVDLHRAGIIFNLPGPMITKRSKISIPGSGIDAIPYSDGKTYSIDE